jgi:hypothetical protein
MYGDALTPVLKQDRATRFDLFGRELELSKFGRHAFGEDDVVAGLDVRRGVCGAHARPPSRARSQASKLDRR